MQSRVGKKWGFAPSQLGFDVYSHYSLFHRERALQKKRVIEALDKGNDGVEQEKVEFVYRQLTSDESLAMTDLLWQDGRWGPARRDVFSPPIWKIRKEYLWRGRINYVDGLPISVIHLRYTRTFGSGSISRKMPGKEDRRCRPRGYENIQEAAERRQAENESALYLSGCEIHIDHRDEERAIIELKEFLIQGTSMVQPVEL